MMGSTVRPDSWLTDQLAGSMSRGRYQHVVPLEDKVRKSQDLGENAEAVKQRGTEEKCRSSRDGLRYRFK